MAYLSDALAAKFYDGCAPTIMNGKLDRAQALLLARRFVQASYPDALCSFAFGSAVRDTFAQYSDLDLLVIDPAPDQQGARRHVFDGCPIEAHVFDRQGFLEALRAAATSGRVNVVFALAECEILTDPSGLGAELCSLVMQVMGRGPPPMSREVASLAYCTIMTSLIELTTNEVEDERFATMVTLQPIMMNFYFGGRKEWANARKWAVRDAPHFAARLNQALQAAYRRGDVGDLATILSELAAPWPLLRWHGAHASERTL